MAGQNIFITGSTGKIGQFLVSRLRNKDCAISLLDNSGIDRRDDAGANYVRGDLLDPEGYASSLEGVDTVVHMAAVTHTNRAEKYYAVNAVGTLNLISACRRYGVRRFIFISTRAIGEDGGDYSRSKLMAERYVQDSALEWVVLRLAEVYGMSSGNGVDMLLDRLHRLPFIPIIGSGDYKICPVHVKDAVFSIEQAICRSDIINRTYTIAGPEAYTYNELTDIILKARGLNKPKVHLPLPLLKSALMVSAFIFGDRFMVKDQLSRLISVKSDDISSARQDLSFNPAGIEEMIGDRGRV